MVIGSDGSQLGVMSRNEALQVAYDDDLDLLCVAPNAQPPVCKILDYGKYRFEAQKKAREAKKNQQVTEIKGLRLSPVIDTNDFNTKLKQATKWLETGNKVKIDMRFRGRMMTRQEVGLKIMNEFIEKTAEIATVDKTPKLEGNIMSCVLTPKKKQEEDKMPKMKTKKTFAKRVKVTGTGKLRKYSNYTSHFAANKTQAT